MKQKDVATIILVGFIGAAFAFGITQFLFKSNTKNLVAEKVDAISAQFNTPDKSVFNDQAINPTQQIQIGDGNNAKPY